MQNKKELLLQCLNKTLADAYALFLKTQNFHWNVSGPSFVTMHELFEKQYHELFLAIDAIAERIRALGHFAPGSFHAYAKLTTVQEALEPIEATEMVERLIRDHETLLHTLRSTLDVAQLIGDHVTTDLCVQRLVSHEKQIWFLKSILGLSHHAEVDAAKE